ncbi:MAG: sugar transferase [Chitinophagaceae bacterium]|nr:sugar transferase [Chitinophagaceae bacterium]
MRSEVKKSIIHFLLSDFITAALSWIIFLVYRKNTNAALSFQEIISKFTIKEWQIIIIVIPIFWLIVYLFSGTYYNPYRKSRITEIYRTLISSMLGCIIIYFFIFLNDLTDEPTYYYKTFVNYLIVHFFITLLGRIIVLQQVKKNINSGKFSYASLMIGGNAEAIKVYKGIINNEIELGYDFKGFVYADESGNNGMSKFLPKLGSINELEKIIDSHKIEEVIIAVDSSEHNKLEDILAQLSHRQVIMKITPDLYDIISGSVRTSNLFAAILIEIYPELMPDWQRVLKRAIDISLSALVILFLLPLYIFAAIKVMLSGKGTIIFKQERIGLYGKPFWIYKFRSMIENAEANGPALSSEDDKRITAWGKFMRKWRIDEIPQFYNILKGDMSLVGPRPERQHFIDLICKTHPHYRYLHKVKPGLTSWGMVKFGYAENINEMIERMKYDLLYIKNCSLVLDIKIMIYTILVILQGRGK